MWKGRCSVEASMKIQLKVTSKKDFRNCLFQCFESILKRKGFFCLSEARQLAVPDVSLLPQSVQSELLKDARMGSYPELLSALTGWFCNPTLCGENAFVLGCILTFWFQLGNFNSAHLLLLSLSFLPETSNEEREQEMHCLQVDVFEQARRKEPQTERPHGQLQRHER